MQVKLMKMLCAVVSTKTSLAINKQKSYESQSISKLIHSNPTGLTCVASKHVDSRAQI